MGPAGWLSGEAIRRAGCLCGHPAFSHARYAPAHPHPGRYYEPLASVSSLDEVLQGPALRKLLFMTRPEVCGCSPATSGGLLSGVEGHGWRWRTLVGSVACRAASAQSVCTHTRASPHCCPLLYNIPGGGLPPEAALVASFGGG